MLHIRSTSNLYGYATIEKRDVFEGILFDYILRSTAFPEFSFRLTGRQFNRLSKCRMVDIQFKGLHNSIYMPNGTLICNLNDVEYTAFVMIFGILYPESECNVNKSLSDLFS